MEPDAETPFMLWGLDPVFSAFAQLFIRDILQMTESTQVPGIYFYNSHPIYKVDILGTVVYKRERDDFFCYGVDDSTGVINCLCWKNEALKEDPAPGGEVDGGGFDPVSEMRRLRRVQQSRCRVEIGELLRVRGSVKMFRHQREISASIFYKVEDPVMVEQISWMTELPQLYRKIYDQRLDPSTSSQPTSKSRASEIIQDFLTQTSVEKFRPHDIQDLLLPLVDQQKTEVVPSGQSQMQKFLREMLQILQDQGLIYRKIKNQDELYTVTEQDKDLLMVVRDVIVQDKNRHAEKGCHILHILSAARRHHSLNLSRSVIERVIHVLETNSDIITVGDDRYTAL